MLLATSLCVVLIACTIAPSAEAKAIRERERAERERIRNRKAEAKIKVREQKGGAGMQITFFDKAPPLSFSRRRR